MKIKYSDIDNPKAKDLQTTVIISDSLECELNLNPANCKGTDKIIITDIDGRLSVMRFSKNEVKKLIRTLQYLLDICEK